jgi:hypothetical protein
MQYQHPESCKLSSQLIPISSDSVLSSTLLCSALLSMLHVCCATEYIGQSIMKFCPDEEELVLEIFKQLGSGNTVRDVPIKFRAKSGAIRHLLIDRSVSLC